MSRRGLSAQRVAARLEETARDLGPRGKDQRFGAGLLDARRLVG
jgi:cell wall-associated protease